VKHNGPTAEEYSRALLVETLRSLIADPSRWAWESAYSFGRSELRYQSRSVRNHCPGWMCDALMESPLPRGSYCSAECKQQTTYIRSAFRRDLERLRQGQAHPCMECGALMFRRTDAKACSTRCYQRWYHRELERQRRAAAKHQEAMA
jgi:hypothetical protein